MSILVDIIKRHKCHEGDGIYSICSANAFVIEAALRHAKIRNAQYVLIEATCNQVNQDGGYTGMKPNDFVQYVFEIADACDFERRKIIFGGDHLGPNPWRAQSADLAMDKAKIMVAEYVAAGFTKIHVDCSMACDGDIAPLSDEIIAKRAAILVEIAERKAIELSIPAPIYVIGTEVPVPGGAHEEISTLSPTKIEDVAKTIETHKQVFNAQGLENVWPRILAIVVQPGVEFDNHQVFDFKPELAKDLSKFIEPFETMVFEAHSTDYQSSDALAKLVIGHFAILKVGPGLTFAFREALWSLDAIECEIVPKEMQIGFRDFVIAKLRENPKYWQDYYFGNESEITRDLQFGLSDRIRYYWPDSEIEEKLNALIANLEKYRPSFGLWSQYMAQSLSKLRELNLELSPKNMILSHIMSVLDMYFYACNPRGE